MENQNQNPKSLLIERLKESNNVLVTVSRNPSVDQLSAAIGLTLMLNHLGKHATAVFSGKVPNTLEFLKPEETLEKNTDSLRDFIISLDKTKADKLRYKVEDKMVKIFITPYRTSLSDADLVFEQGDFNVDVVVAIGVQEKEDLDEAITSHGRILHDATVATLNTVMSGQLGSINWVDAKTSSLCEMLVQVCETLKAGALDAQMATAFLTGIVAETQRFSNEKTSSETMSISAKLMNAGANQQLIATKLKEPTPPAIAPKKGVINQAEDAVEDALNNDGSLDISHTAEEKTPEQPEDEGSDLPDVQPDHQPEPEEQFSRFILQPPTLSGTLTANSKPEGLDPSTDPMTLPLVDPPLLSHDDNGHKYITPSSETEKTLPPETSATAPISELSAEEVSVPEQPKVEESTSELAPTEDIQTLSDLESAVHSPHIANKPAETDQTEKSTPDADAALAAAHDAINSADQAPEKPAAFNSTGLMDVGHDEPADNEAPADVLPPQSVNVAIDSTGTLSYPTNLVPPTGLPSDPTAGSVSDPTAPPLPPTVPPPMVMPPLIPSTSPSDNGFPLPPARQ